MMEITAGKKLNDLFHATGERKEEHRVNTGLWALYHKEMRDHIRSRRFLLILGLIALTSFASLYGALTGIRDVAADNSDFIFLKLFTTSGSSIPSFLSFIALLGPFVGLTLGFDAINSERASGTLNRLASQPIYRDSIINGKFLAGASIIFGMVFSMGIIIAAMGMLLTGMVPEVEEVGRIFVFLFLTGVYICFWLGLSILFSVVCRHAATSALAVIACWLFFAIFMSLLAGIIANALYPVDGVRGRFNAVKNYSCEQNLNRLSPYYLYSEAVTTILNPNIRSVNVVTMSQLSGAIAGYLSFGQSLLLIWPHLTGMCAMMLVTFAVSYISFMKQEIRTN